ncbi:MAG: carbon-nitrogen hydrolase family protein [Verrucomicrobiae bacterium]|nr:carbon-nitrogen hydrolase family protein [Verrucomicrobiae bacterium]
MARHLKIASLLFSQRHLGGQPGAREAILRDTRDALAGVAGLGVNLVVTSEAIEALAQTVEQAEDPARPGPLLQTYMEFAAKERCHVAGSVKLLADGRPRNSVAFLGSKGEFLGAYHKTFLTRQEIEEGLVPGHGPVIIPTAIGKLGGVICFDLNFNELRLRYAALKPDVLVFPSMYHGGLMQKMWAYSCRAFFVSALYFDGGGILDPLGEPLALTDGYNPAAFARINLDRVVVHLDFNRDKFPEILRKYGDEVRIVIPPNLAPALIYSESEKRSATDLVREFGLQLLDEYLEESVALNARTRDRLLE